MGNDTMFSRRLEKMNQIKIGEFLKELRKEKNLHKNSLQNNLMYHEGLYQDGKLVIICLT